MAVRPIFPGTIKTAGLDIEPADTTTAQALVTAGSAGSRIDKISITSDDTAAMVVELSFYNGTTDYILGTVAVPAGSGTDGTNPAVSALNATDFPFLGEDLSIMIGVGSGYAIRAAVQTTVTTAKKLQLVAQYGDY